MSKDESLIEFGSFRLDPVERSLVGADGRPIQLTRKLFDVLLFMVERPGRLLEKQALLDAVWRGTVVEENTLSRTISSLRQALGDGTGTARYIETVPALGYRFVQPVSRASAARPRAPHTLERSIAVLPFEDLSRERDQGYFADGIAEEILDRLASLVGLRVIAKSSSFRFRDQADSAQAIGRRLGVNHLLVGAVRKDGARVRVTAQLVEAATESQLWSERFDRELVDVFAIQDDIARAVAHALSATLGVGEPTFVENATKDLEAYDLYLRGRAVTNQTGILRATELFREAVTRDPEYAAAWFNLAAMSRVLVIFAPQHAARAVRDVEEAVAKTVALTPRWWSAHVAQSWPHHLRREWLAMERALERAAALAPGTPWELSLNLGVFHSQVRETSTAVEHFRAAVRGDPLSLLTSGLYQLHLHMAGRDDEAELEYRRTQDLAGDREMIEHVAIHRRWAGGAPFREELRRFLDLAVAPMTVMTELLAVCDEAALALEKLHNALAAPEYQHGSRQLQLGWWLARYGDVEAAFDATWRGFVELRYPIVSWLWFPILARVREHPRFPELLTRVGLTDYWRVKGKTPELVARASGAAT